MSNGTPEGIICNALPLSTMKLAFTFFLQDYFIAGVVEHRVVPPINCMQVGTKKERKMQQQNSLKTRQLSGANKPR